MKVRASVKRICNHCKIIRRKGVVRVICKKTQNINKDKDKIGVKYGKNCWCRFT